MEDQLAAIAPNYQRVLDKIAAACRAAGRSVESVRLVVVTKGHGLDAVERVVAAGARCLGENYVEEASEKIHRLAVPGVDWRMIGHVQSRKANQVAELFAACDSLDSLKLAERLDRFAGQAGRRLPVLLECNVSGETTKFGWPAWVEDRWPELAGSLAALLDLEHLEIQGLMCMPPYFDQPELARPFFQRLRRLQAFLSARLPQSDWRELSMGMSGDYEVAIQEGATQVRVGTAILGQRQPG
ncbi:MAG: YggS family pyridoxal phosphate-dependent enzyme [Anaerolineales bacterium]|jgi:hypothetical protein|nr:YggS family pyridoxal phosphate-dependent enzyme [Anaerolineales bacterium]